MKSSASDYLTFYLWTLPQNLHQIRWLRILASTSIFLLKLKKPSDIHGEIIFLNRSRNVAITTGEELGTSNKKLQFNVRSNDCENKYLNEAFAF